MSDVTIQRDLVVLVADQDYEYAIKGLLSRPESLRIRPVDAHVIKHINRDSGCRSDASNYLRTYSKRYDFALVIFDLRGCGDNRSRDDIQKDIEYDLHRNGWEERSKAIVIDPELESWVWSQSNKVPTILGWGTDFARLKSWLENRNLWPPEQPKPPAPKKAMRSALREKKKPVSSELFGELARTVTLHRCQDPAFNELRETLRAWFPPEAAR